ncbi:MAG: choice-of-anchor J domain-containing protein [Muribaculaceae bacterium]|nr:choice-of-anchor J domain-containing protein [Muribaculaceae bacterium]
MKINLLIYAGALTALTATTALTLPAAEKGMAVKPQMIQAKNAHAVSENKLQLAPGVSISVVNGHKQLHAHGLDAINRLSQSTLRAPRKETASMPEGYVLYESFENWDGENTTWVPDGWTLEHHGDAPADETWQPMAPGYYLPKAPDGQYFLAINYGEDQDEWYMSPFVTVPEDMNLSYWLWLEPLWLMKVDDNVDWDALEWIDTPEVAADLQIWVQEEGGEWTMLRSYFDLYKDYSFNEVASIPGEFKKNTISLADYYGKSIRVAFRYVGTDGNMMMIDAIGIGYPSINNLAYYGPFDMQYWGLIRDPNMVAINSPVAIYPVETPVVWTTLEVEDNVTYTWTYADPETGADTTSDDPDELSLTYHPDYSTENTSRCNLQPAPVLHAEAPKMIPSEYSAPYTAVQFGGTPVEVAYAEDDEEEPALYPLTVMPFCLQDRGLGILTVDDERIGDLSIPVFGYNVNTDQYWLNYSLRDTDGDESTYSHLIAIANLIFPTSEAPLVVNGGNVYGYGEVADDAQFTMTIRGISAETGSTAYDEMDIIASKTITGADILRQDPQKSYMCLPFDFDAPVVLQADDKYIAFFVMFEGFNSDKVTYFAPLQTATNDPFGFCQGYIVNHIDLEAVSGRPAYYSTKTMRYLENGEDIDIAGAFAIGLNAEYPWLTCDVESVELPYGGDAVEVALGSYYDGSSLTVDAPAGVEASVSGRYGNCVLTLKHDQTEVEVEGDVVVKGPGVEVKIGVTAKSSRIGAISAEGLEVAAVYDLLGRRVSAKEAAAKPGVYVVKYIDGKSGKVVVK